MAYRRHAGLLTRRDRWPALAGGWSGFIHLPGQTAPFRPPCDPNHLITRAHGSLRRGETFGQKGADRAERIAALVISPSTAETRRATNENRNPLAELA